MKGHFFNTAAVSLITVATAFTTAAAPVVRQGTGANAAALLAIVDQFRADLGGANNGVGGTFKTGRRELNWDGVPTQLAYAECEMRSAECGMRNAEFGRWPGDLVALPG